MSVVRTNDFELTRVSPSICLEARIRPTNSVSGRIYVFAIGAKWLAPTRYPRTSFSRVKCEMRWVDRGAREKLQILRKPALDTTP